MNKKLVALISLFALVTVFLPGLVMGMEEQEDNKELRKNANRLLEKMRKKQIKKTPAFATDETIPEKNVNPVCLICKKAMKTAHCITVHLAKDSNGNSRIPHQFHAKCLVEYMRSKEPNLFLFHLSGPHVQFSKKNDDPQADYDFDTHYAVDGYVPVPCLLCAEPDGKTETCFVKKSELHKKYLAHIESLSLRERFLILDKLPIKYGRLALIAYAKLSPEEKKQICDVKTSRLLLQKLAIKTAYPPRFELEFYGESWISYIEEMLIDHGNALIREIIKLLKKQPITLEFAQLLIKEVTLSPKKKKTLFLWALEADCLLAPFLKSTDITDPEKLDEFAMADTEGVNNQLLALRKIVARIELAEIAFSSFTKYERGSYYEQILEKAKTTIEKKAVENKLKPLL